MFGKICEFIFGIIIASLGLSGWIILVQNNAQGEYRGNRHNRGRNRYYNRNKQEGKSNFEGNQSEGKGTP